VPAGSAAAGGKFRSVRIKLRAAAGLRHSPRSYSFANALAQIFFQPGEGGFIGVVILPIGEIGQTITFRHWTVFVSPSMGEFRL
jgi:hypothetical protein